MGDRASAPLAGHVILITGASKGIGLACTRTLAALGASVAMVARTADVLARAAADVRAATTEQHTRIVAFPADVTVPEQVDDLARRIRAELGEVDILVNNAGAFRLGATEHLSPEDFERTVAVNLTAPWRLARTLLSGMRARGRGHVVTIGSIADRAVFPENGAYAASKHGLRALHEVMRLELKGSGVRATLVSPGPVDTPLWDEVQPDGRPGFTPRAQMLAAADVADAVAFAITRPHDVNIDELRLGRA